MSSELANAVNEIAKKAEKAEKAIDCQQLSQAALNLANAKCSLDENKRNRQASRPIEY